MIVIAGKNEIAIHGLRLALGLFNKRKIIAVPNDSDDGIDRWQPSFKRYAQISGVRIATLDEVYDCPVDLFLSLEFDKIISPEKIKSKKVFNLHFSLLPKYKGMYTSVWPILYGDRESGVSLHKIDRGIDTGDLLDQNTFELTDTDRSQDCYRKYLNSSKDLLSRNFNQLAGNEILQCYSQNYEKSSYYSKNSIDFSSLRIDFKKTAWQIKRFVYAFSFRPYQLIKFNGRDVVDILITKNQSRLNPGQIIRDYGDQAVISTIDYDIHIIFDNLDNFLLQIPTITLADFKVKIMNTLGINDRNKIGWSPIIVASFNGRLDIVDFLLTQGANINDRNNNGTTVLMYAKDFALKSCNKEIIQFLLEKGADVNLLDFHGKSVLDYLTKSEASFLELNK